MLMASLRTAVAWTHAGRVGADPAASSDASTIAQAPSDAGQVSRYRIGSHSIGESATCSKLMSSWCRWAYGFFNAFNRSFTTTLIPTSSGALERRMYSLM
jgi:hypothetical protein